MERSYLSMEARNVRAELDAFLRRESVDDALPLTEDGRPPREDELHRARSIWRVGAFGAAALALVGVLGVLASPAARATAGISLVSAASGGGGGGGSATVLAAAAASERTFDESGRFIMRAFDRFKPMSSFLPGVGGLWGVPTWASVERTIGGGGGGSRPERCSPLLRRARRAPAGGPST